MLSSCSFMMPISFTLSRFGCTAPPRGHRKRHRSPNKQSVLRVPDTETAASMDAVDSENRNQVNVVVGNTTYHVLTSRVVQKPCLRLCLPYP